MLISCEDILKILKLSAHNQVSARISGDLLSLLGETYLEAFSAKKSLWVLTTHLFETGYK